MKTSTQGQDFIKSYEKFRSLPYKDQGAKWSVGYGHLILPGEDFSNGLTHDQADELFLSDLHEKAEQPVMNAIQADMSQAEWDACCSLCFNIGAGNFHNSTLVKLFNSGADVYTIAQQFQRWDKVNGQESAGLLARRKAEADIFLNGHYVNHA